MSNEIKSDNKLEEVKSNLKTYLKGVKSEWGKITWPQPNQVKWETIIVAIIVFLITAFVYIIDISFKYLFSYLN